MTLISARGEFRSASVVLCQPDDHRLHQRRERAGYWVQRCRGPILLVIDARVSNAKCADLARRLNLSAADVRAYRNSLA